MGKQKASLHKWSCFFIALCLLASGSGPWTEKGYAAPVVPSSAWDVAGAMNPGWNLGNSLEIQNLTYGHIAKDSYGEPNFDVMEKLLGNPVTTKVLIDEVAKLGFKSIRIPVSFYNHLIGSKPRETASDGSYVYHPGHTIDPDWLARIKQVVDWALDAGLYVVINDHHDTSMWMNISWIYAQADDLSNQLPAFIDLWEEYATYFKDYDNRLLFQATGEIVSKTRSFDASDYLDFRAAHGFSQAFIETVRGTGGNNAERFLILPTYASNSGILYVDESFYEPYTDSASDKLLFSVHNYAKDPEDLAWTFSTLYNRAVKYGMPFIMDECGPNVYDELSVRKEVCYTLASQAEKYGMSVFIWDAGVAEMGYIDRAKTIADGSVAYVNSFTHDGVTYTTDSKAVIEALFQGKQEAQPVTEAEKAKILDNTLKAVSFEYLNRSTLNHETAHGPYLRYGSYTNTHEGAANPVSVYAPIPSYYACLYPYVEASGLVLQGTVPDQVSIVFRELDANGNFLRQKYITSSGGWYAASPDAVYAAVYFRDATEKRTFADYRAYVESGELELYRGGGSPYQEPVEDVFYISAGGKTFTVDFADTPAAREMKARMQEGPLSLSLGDPFHAAGYVDFEFSDDVRSALRSGRLEVGDVAYIDYRGRKDTVVIVWSVSSAHMLIGKIRDVTERDLTDTFRGSVETEMYVKTFGPVPRSGVLDHRPVWFFFLLLLAGSAVFGAVFAGLSGKNKKIPPAA